MDVAWRLDLAAAASAAPQRLAGGALLLMETVGILRAAHSVSRSRHMSHSRRRHQGGMAAQFPSSTALRHAEASRAYAHACVDVVRALECALALERVRTFVRAVVRGATSSRPHWAPRTRCTCIDECDGAARRRDAGASASVFDCAAAIHAADPSHQSLSCVGG